MLTSVNVGNGSYYEGTGYSFECEDETKRPDQNNSVIGQVLDKGCVHWSVSPKHHPLSNVIGRM